MGLAATEDDDSDEEDTAVTDNKDDDDDPDDDDDDDEEDKEDKEEDDDGDDDGKEAGALDEGVSAEGTTEMVNVALLRNNCMHISLSCSGVLPSTTLFNAASLSATRSATGAACCIAMRSRPVKGTHNFLGERY